MSSAAAYGGPSSPCRQQSTDGFRGDEDGDADIPRRLMQVKVLYTFDDGNKTNCLARLPQPLSIPTVQLDESAQVGVVELKTCIQAIIQHSPELVGKLDSHDFTVYAYDYSEYETPLVGQGMLSWVLASASPTPNAPAHESKTMVTGRVCKNFMGIFAKGPRETLEVKLKLVPVPTVMQKEYLDSMDRYRQLSKVIPGDFDPNTWSTFCQANPSGVRPPSRDAAPAASIRTPSSTLDRQHSGNVESIHQLLRQNSFSDAPNSYQSSYGTHNFHPQSTRLPSPTPSFQSASAFEHQPDIESRPGSRASVRSERPIRPRVQSFDASAMSDTPDDGPPKKRARTTKAKWRGKSNLGMKSDSLLQTASAANSVRLHRPTPMHMGQTIQPSIEPPPRVPTPIPGSDAGPLRRRQSNGTSLLRNASYLSMQREPSMMSDLASEGFDSQIGSIAPSSPREWLGGSSPPVIDNSPPASSPVLPAAVPFMSDSGFVSDLNIDSEGPVEVARPKREHNSNIADTSRDPNEAIPRAWPPEQMRNKHQPWMSVMPGPAHALPTKAPIVSKEKHSKARSASGTCDPPGHVRPATAMQSSPYPYKQPSAGAYVSPYTPIQPYKPSCNQQQKSATPQAPPLTAPNTQAHTIVPPPTETASQDTCGSKLDPEHEPQPPNNEPDVKAESPLENNASVAQQQEEPSSKPGEARSDETKQPRSGAGAPRTKSIRNDLESCVNSGNSPRYCENCGEIHTSTWRKAYTGLFNGTTESLIITKNFKEEGGIVGFVTLPQEKNNGVPQYRVFKKVPSKWEKDNGSLQALSLCNSCGLWFDKYGAMRPPNRWDNRRKGKDEKLPKTKLPRKKKGQTEGEQTEESTSEVDQKHPPLQRAITMSGTGVHDQVAPPAVHTKRARAASIDVPRTAKLQRTRQTNDIAAAALQRAIQSSPARFLGSQESPIEIEADLTPKPVRRTLFPSPRRNGEFKDLEHSANPGKIAGAGDSATSSTSPSKSPIEEDFDKENCPPVTDNNNFDDLFEEEESTKVCPSTPKSNKKVVEQSGSKHKSPAFSTPKTPNSRIRNRVPLTPQIADTLASVNFDIMTPSRVSRGVDAIVTDNYFSPSSIARVFDMGHFPLDTGIMSDDWLNFPDFSTDLPIPSDNSDFDVYVDPATSNFNYSLDFGDHGLTANGAADIPMSDNFDFSLPGEDNSANMHISLPAAETHVPLQLEEMGLGLDIFESAGKNIIGSEEPQCSSTETAINETALVVSTLTNDDVDVAAS